MSSVMDAPPPTTCQHPSHPAHELSLVQVGGSQFTCDGCKQGGQEDRRYRCPPCDFDLHIQCALAPPVFPHPMFGGRSFTLCSGMANRFCDACGDAVRGAVYHDSQGNLDLHPCCAFLKASIGHPGRVFQLGRKVAASCMRCGQNGPRGNFWSYALYDNGGVAVENIHVACMLYGDHNQTGAAGDGRSRSTFTHQISSPHMAGYPTSSPHMSPQITPNFSHQISSSQMTGYPTYSPHMSPEITPNFSHQISSSQMTGYPTYSPHMSPQMTGYPNFSHPISSLQMTGYPTFTHQISSPQMTSYPTYSPQMTGYATFGHQISNPQMTGYPTFSHQISSPQMRGNRPTSGQMMTGNPTSSPQMRGNRPTSGHMMTGNPTSSQMMAGTSFLGVMNTISAPIELASSMLMIADNAKDWMGNEDEGKEDGEEGEEKEEEDEDEE